ncbi:cell wall-active antibiotics response protein LiaF [Chloroflexota bacterium]
MRDWRFIIIGGLLIVFGLLALLSNFIQIDFGDICWPTILILIGIMLLVGPRLNRSDKNINIQPLADIKRRGQWVVEDEEIWLLVGDVKLDLSEADIPPGETKIRTMGFVGGIRLTLPADIGFEISSTAFLNELRTPDEKSSTFVSSVKRRSEGYQEASRKIRLDAVYFVADIRVKYI